MVSVIIPVYQVEAYLERCLQSLLSQTYKNLEIILIDDGSPDHCPTICDDFAKKDSRIQVIHQENQGVSMARNKGLDVASGDYILFVDSDDYLEPTMCETLFSHAISHEAGIVACNWFDEEMDCVTIPNLSKTTVAGFCSKEQAMQNIVPRDTYHGYCWNKLFARSLLGQGVNRIQFHPQLKVCEDLMFWVEIFPKAERFFFTETPLYHYVKRDNSAMGKSNYSGKRTLDGIYVREQLCTLWSEWIRPCDREKLQAYDYNSLGNYIFEIYKDKGIFLSHHLETLARYKESYLNTAYFTAEDKVFLEEKMSLLFERVSPSDLQKKYPPKGYEIEEGIL